MKISLSNVIRGRLEHFLHACCPMIEESLLTISFMHIQYFVPSSNGTALIGSSITPPQHCLKQHSTIRNLKCGVLLRHLNKRFGFLSDIQAHWADPIHAEIDSSWPHLMPQEKKKKHRLNRCTVFTHNPRFGGLSILGKVDSEEMYISMLLEGRTGFLWKNGDFSFNVVVWSMTRG